MTTTYFTVNQLADDPRPTATVGLRALASLTFAAAKRPGLKALELDYDLPGQPHLIVIRSAGYRLDMAELRWLDRHRPALHLLRFEEGGETYALLGLS